MTKKKPTGKTGKKAPAGSRAGKPSVNKKDAKKKTSPKKPAAKKVVSKKTTTNKVTKKTKKTVKKVAAATKPTAEKTPGKTPGKRGKTKSPAKASPATKKPASKKDEKKKTVKSRSGKSPRRNTKTTKTTAPKIPRGRSVMEVASLTAADSDGYVIISGRRVRMMKAQSSPESKAELKSNKKKTRTVSAKTEGIGDPAESIVKPEKKKKVKTKLTSKELTHYRNLLLLKRRELMGDLTSHEDQALRPNHGDSSTMPIHMADIGSDTYEQDFMLGMAEQERERVKEIDAALGQIEKKTYGVCQMTGEMIPQTRLEVKPWARYTIEAARKMEVKG